MTEKGGLSARTWNAVTAGVLLLAVALGILLYMSTDDMFSAVWAILIVFGLYMCASSAFRKSDNSGFGPSEADMAVAGGALIAGVGVSGVVYTYTGEVLYTVVAIIVIIAVVGIVMAVKNREL